MEEGFAKFEYLIYRNDRIQVKVKGSFSNNFLGQRGLHQGPNKLIMSYWSTGRITYEMKSRCPERLEKSTEVKRDGILGRQKVSLCDLQWKCRK